MKMLVRFSISLPEVSRGQSSSLSEPVRTLC